MTFDFLRVFLREDLPNLPRTGVVVEPKVQLIVSLNVLLFGKSHTMKQYRQDSLRTFVVQFFVVVTRLLL